jgi:hypothetical protein
MSACVIEQTIPGSVLSARTVVRKPNWPAAFHSAMLVPPNSSRSRILMIRAACDLVQVPERLRQEVMIERYAVFPDTRTAANLQVFFPLGSKDTIIQANRIGCRRTIIEIN